MRRVILAGCGHAHLEVVRGAAGFRQRGAELLVIDPGRFWYSGLGSALLGGRVDAEAASLDVRRLAEACGARSCGDRLVGLDLPAREALLGSGRRIGYDLVSLNIGSSVASTGRMEQAGGVRVKPIAAIDDLRAAIAGRKGSTLAVVIGGGATGCEIAGNLLHLAASGTAGPDGLCVTLVTASASLVPEAPQGLRARALRSLERRGAEVRLSNRVVGVEGGQLRLASGEALAFDHLILATGLQADPLVGRLGLPVRAAGLRISDRLQSLGDARVFAAGDCAAIEGYDLPKIGVYGVREGPVLLRNLLAALDGAPLEAFRPQKRFLSILDLADGKGLAMRGGVWSEGRLALRLKNHLDRRFLDRYARLYDGGERR